MDFSQDVITQKLFSLAGWQLEVKLECRVGRLRAHLSGEGNAFNETTTNKSSGRGREEAVLVPELRWSWVEVG